jgi:hypothetical protein
MSESKAENTLSCQVYYEDLIKYEFLRDGKGCAACKQLIGLHTQSAGTVNYKSSKIYILTIFY